MPILDLKLTYPDFEEDNEVVTLHPTPRSPKIVVNVPGHIYFDRWFSGEAKTPGVNRYPDNWGAGGFVHDLYDGQSSRFAIGYPSIRPAYYAIYSPLELRTAQWWTGVKETPVGYVIEFAFGEAARPFKGSIGIWVGDTQEATIGVFGCNYIINPIEP